MKKSRFLTLLAQRHHEKPRSKAPPWNGRHSRLCLACEPFRVCNVRHFPLAEPANQLVPRRNLETRGLCSARSVRFLLLSFALAAVFISGCGRRVIPKDVLAGAESSYEQAVKLVASKSYAEALPLLDKALGPGGGLNADLVADAFMARAQCNAEVGNIEKAELDLKEAEKGAGDMTQLSAVKALVVKKKGTSSTAK